MKKATFDRTFRIFYINSFKIKRERSPVTTGVRIPLFLVHEAANYTLS
jgi:hypothetical protein